MDPTLAALIRRIWPAGLILALAAVAWWSASIWAERNLLMDGYQNEFLHVGNALDLWGAWFEHDRWNLKELLRSNYWPPGFYLWPEPLFLLLGASHRVMVLSNVGHLLILLIACYRLGAMLSGPGTGALAAGLVSIYPSIFGNLTRYEPNLAVAAWVTAGAYCLVRARSFEDRRWSIAFGLACGIGLMMDRISLAMFLALPALIEALAGLRSADLRSPARLRRRLVHGGLGLLVLALVAGYWHWEFSQRHLDELLSQSAAGEIDAAGERTEQRDLSEWTSWLFYPATLMDSQAGLIPGAAALLALLASLVVMDRRRRAPVVICLVGLALFTLIQKKQAYYTIPLLGILAALTADRLRALGLAGRPLAGLILLAGLHQYGLQLWGEGLPLPHRIGTLIGAPALPEAWVAPRYPQARPPRDLPLPLPEIVAALPDGDVVVFSDDQTWFEGFVVLGLREARLDRRIRGLISNPKGTYEWARTASAVVYVSTSPEIGWPTRGAMEASLKQHHYALEELPPVVDLIEELEPRFRLTVEEPMPHGGVALVFVNALLE